MSERIKFEVKDRYYARLHTRALFLSSHNIHTYRDKGSNDDYVGTTFLNISQISAPGNFGMI